ncbi:SGNH/GDSL hydrolase family protein [Maricaulis sp.]|uniref:SGNH/GDSL hydrolase family protein n=1 Tax=Maricaulis sp. TaxID=1486257 RepID=UPI002618B5FD|nr:SGNH/GDSL hydrolase family protein [Maricaulis sp.]
MKKLLLATVGLCALSAAPAQAQTWDLDTGRFFVFGDSLSDTANIFTATGTGGAPVYFNGRFSNGPVWHEYFRTDLALSPFLAGPLGDTSSGINFAHGGARTTAFETAPGVFLPGSVEQAGAFASYVGAGSVSAPTADDVFAVWIGGNNFLSALGTGGLPDIAAGVADVSTTLQTLAGAGAQRFLLFNLPLLGEATDQTGGLAVAINNASRAFNDGLREVDRSVSAAAGVDILYIDIAAVFSDVRANPGDYGFSEVVTDCLSQGLLLNACPADWADYDGIHPTAGVHQLLANYVVATGMSADYAATAVGGVTQVAHEVASQSLAADFDAARVRRDASGFYLGGAYVDGGSDAAMGRPGTNWDGSGLTLGFAGTVNDNAFFGLQFGGMNGTAGIDGALSGSTEFDQNSVAGYAGLNGDGYYAMIGATLGSFDFDGDRATGFAPRASVTSDATVDFKSFAAEFGTGVDAAGTDLELFLNARTTTYTFKDFTENGPLLTVEGGEFEFDSTEIGAGARTRLELGDSAALELNGRYVHELDGDRELEVLLNGVDVSSAAFGVADDNFVELGGDFTREMQGGSELSFSLRGRFADASDGFIAQLGWVKSF